MFKSIILIVLITGLAACSAKPPQPAPPRPAVLSANAIVNLPAAGTYAVDTAHSQLRLLIYRAGKLSALGHNHVMVNRALMGTVQIGDVLSDCTFTLQVPVAKFEIDDSVARREEGSDFPGDIPDEAKAGTLHNMASAALLNAEAHPLISVIGASFRGNLQNPEATMIVEVAGRQSTITTPLTLTGDSQRLTASGAFELRQTALGLVPYSLFGGGLQVQDAIQVKFELSVPLRP